MHAYSTDESRVAVYSVLAILAVILAWLITVLTSRFDWPQWLVSAPSMGAMFALLYQLFDKYCWRWPVFRHMGLVGIRDVSGRYEGSLTSTYREPNGSAVTRGVALNVHQTWTKLMVEMKVTSGASSSVSVSALGSVSDDNSVSRLTYVYANRVNPGLADEDMGDHDGAASIRIDKQGRVEGRYFNSRPRAGTITASKV